MNKSSDSTIVAVIMLGCVLLAIHAHSQVKPTSSPSERCAAISDATQSACADEMANAWNDQGGDLYSRQEHLKDIAVCRHIAEAATMACKKGTE